ncbi:MAG: DUF4253 domain-containing protein [Lachnospiraceae bacterium]|nr:DUF4253 domain-containing protein [Lachnospiraceae bacterium]
MALFKEAPYKEAVQNIIDVIGCNYKVFDTTCTTEEVNRIYLEEIARGKKEGFIPVLVPCDDILDEWFHLEEEDKENIKEETTSTKRQAIIDAAADNGKELLQEWYNSSIEDFADDESELQNFLGEFGNVSADDFESEEDYEDFIEEYGENEPINELSAFAMFSEDDGIQETILFEVPVDEPWKVIGWFPIGGWNECPAPEDMITICRYWYKKYGAYPAVITHDVIEFYVEKPVTDKDEAWELAKEHFAFSTDRVYQCTATYTLGEVAGCLMDSKVWYFWWD